MDAYTRKRSLPKVQINQFFKKKQTRNETNVKNFATANGKQNKSQNKQNSW